MIELILDDRCTGCDICVRVCPTNVFDAVAASPPVIARQPDCQTCFMCELHCPADALYVAPVADGPTPVDAATVIEAGWVGRYRRDSGWGATKGDPAHANESWRMDQAFARARALAAKP